MNFIFKYLKNTPGLIERQRERADQCGFCGNMSHLSCDLLPLVKSRLAEPYVSTSGTSGLELLASKETQAGVLN
jgi:hypothetical protein